MLKQGFVYILTNKFHKVLYIGVTSNLETRIQEHKMKEHPNSFSARYNTDQLVYFEEFYAIDQAIVREKQLKAGSRQKKLDLINDTNPFWKDLTADWDVK